MKKNQIREFVETQIAEFQKPNYNPYQFEEYVSKLKDLGFKSSTAEFVKNHPELMTEFGIDTETDAFLQAVNFEQDIVALGNFALAYGRDEMRSAYTMNSIDFKRHIPLLEALAKICK